MPGREGGKAKPLKKAKAGKAELDDDDKVQLQVQSSSQLLVFGMMLLTVLTDLSLQAFQAKKREEAAALKELKEKAGQKGGFAKGKGK